MKKYLIKIFTKYLQTKFEIDSSSEITDLDTVHKHVIDLLGKNDINWEPNHLRYTGGFYITYEEVTNGPRQHGVVREEAEARI